MGTPHFHPHFLVFYTLYSLYLHSTTFLMSVCVCERVCDKGIFFISFQKERKKMRRRKKKHEGKSGFSYQFWFFYIWFMRLWENLKIISAREFLFYPCWEKEKIIFCLAFVPFFVLEIVLLLLCQICVWMWDLQSFSLLWLSWRHWLLFSLSATSLTQFLFRDFCFWPFTLFFFFNFLRCFFSLLSLTISKSFGLLSSKSYFCFPFLFRFGQWWLWYCSLVEDFWFLGSLQWKNRWSSKFKM